MHLVSTWARTHHSTRPVKTSASWRLCLVDQAPQTWLSILTASLRVQVAITVLTFKQWAAVTNLDHGQTVLHPQLPIRASMPCTRTPNMASKEVSPLPGVLQPARARKGLSVVLHRSVHVQQSELVNATHHQCLLLLDMPTLVKTRVIRSLQNVLTLSRQILQLPVPRRMSTLAGEETMDGVQTRCKRQSGVDQRA